MLDMGFKPAVDRIVTRSRRDRQTLFFSATLEGEVGKLAKAYTATPAATSTAADRRRPTSSTASCLSTTTASSTRWSASCATATAAARWSSSAPSAAPTGWSSASAHKDVHAVAMHGNKSQSQRQKALASFESGHVDTLVATDVAARGIDVADITHVINFDAPEDRDAYVHRIGRTGRAGRTGDGVSS